MKKIKNEKFKLYFSAVISVFLFLVTLSPVTSVSANETLDGDMTHEEGAKEYVMTEEDKMINELKEQQIKKDKMGRYVPDGIEYTLSVPVFKQPNGYYCAPATVKQVIQFIKGSSSTQASYASRLGTTTAGTDMTKIAPLLRADTGKTYIYSSIGTLENWGDRIESGCKVNMPAILDINTNSVSSFPYRTSGHFVNTSGISTRSGVFKVRITDPYGPGLGNIWYRGGDVYNANNNHFRKAMIW